MELKQTPSARRVPRRVGRTALGAAVAALAATGATTGPVIAAPIQWDGGASGGAGKLKWDDATNWASNDTKPGIADIAVFVSTGLNSGDTIDTGAGQTVGQLRFGPTAANAADFTQDLTLAGGPITLYGVENNNGLRIGIQRTDKAGGVNAVNSHLTLANDVFFQVAALNDAGRLVINGVIGETGGARGFTKTGGQALELNGDNTYTGVTTVRQNNVVIGHANALGAGASAVVVGNADANTNNAAGLLTKSGVTFGRDVVVVNGATGARRLGGADGQTSSTWTGNVYLNRATNFTAGTNAPNGVVEFAGAIRDGTDPAQFAGSTVTKVEAGTVKFGGANTYSGATNVNAGTLVVNGSLSDGAGAVTVAGAARLGGDGVIARPVTLAAGATIAPGDAGTGTLTLSGNHALTFGDGAVLEWELGATPTSSDLLSVSTLGFQGTPLARLLENGNQPLAGTPYVLLEWSGADPSVLPAWALDPASTLSGQINYVGGSDGLAGGRVEFSAVPEPGAVGFLGLAGVALLGRRRRRSGRVRGDA